MGKGESRMNEAREVDGPRLCKALKVMGKIADFIFSIREDVEGF